MTDIERMLLDALHADADSIEPSPAPSTLRDPSPNRRPRAVVAVVVLVLGIVATGWLVRHSTSRHTSVASSPATESSATSTLPVGQTSTTADAVEGDQPNPVQVTGYAIGDRPDPNKPAPGPDDRPYWIAVTDTNTFLVVGYVLGADMFGPPSDGSVPLIVYDEDGRRVGILAEGGFVPDN